MWRAWRGSGRGRAPSRPHRRLVLDDRSATCDPARRRRNHHVLPLASTAGSPRAPAPSSRTRSTSPTPIVEEHGQLLRTDLVNMVRDIDAAAGKTCRPIRSPLNSSLSRKQACANCQSPMCSTRTANRSSRRFETNDRLRFMPLDPAALQSREQVGRSRSQIAGARNLPRAGHRQAQQLSRLLPLCRPRRSARR
jgi:hypothetical protein